MNNVNPMTGISPVIPPNKAQKWTAPGFLSGLVLILALGATCCVWWNVRQEAADDLKSEFDFRVSEIEARIAQRLTYYRQVLRGAQGFFAASDKNSLIHFHTYIDASQLRELYPGIQNIGIALLVSDVGKQRHIAEMRRKGFPAYTVWPEGRRPFYAAVSQLELHVNANTSVMGYDMYSDPVRSAAMKQARDQGTAIISGKAKLLLQSDEQSGFIMFLPIYKNGKPHQTLSERRANIAGWVYVPFHMNSLMSQLNFKSASDLDIEIYDGEERSEKTLMFDSVVHPFGSRLGDTDLHAKRRIEFAGRSWLLSIRPLPIFEARVDKFKPKLIAGVGVFMSFLLAWFTWGLASGRSQALAQAAQSKRELNESEKRFRVMANSAPVMIWLSDKYRKHLWINKYWYQFTGHSDVDDIRSIFLQYVHPDDRQNMMEIHDAAIQRREAFISEFRAQRLDGEYRWMLNNGTPRYDEAGNYVGYIGTCFDITERKIAEQELKLAALVYQNSSESMCVGALAADGTIRVIAVNPASEIVTGFKSEDLLGKDMMIFRTERHDDAFYQEITRSLYAVGHWEGEHWSRRKNGEHYLTWLNVSAVINEVDTMFRVVALSRDITRQKEYEDTIRSLSSNLITAKEDEARRIAREIHDDLGQRLFWLRRNLHLLPDLLQNQPDLLNEKLESMKASTTECVQIIKNIANNLRPPIFDMGFELAIESLVEEFSEQSGIECVLTNKLCGDENFVDVYATNVFRILQETLTNVARHANASRVDVLIETVSSNLHLEIKDNGIGFDTESKRKPRSHGLTSMRERAAMLGGEINIHCSPQAGVTVSVVSPIPKDWLEWIDGK